jgi:hypothetical protein
LTSLEVLKKSHCSCRPAFQRIGGLYINEIVGVKILMTTVQVHQKHLKRYRGYSDVSFHPREDQTREW